MAIDQKLNVAIIGFGYWGPNLVRNFSLLSNARVMAIVDARPERRAVAQKSYPNVQVVGTPEEVFSNPDINAVVVATPVLTHFPLAKLALESGKHVLVEKPVTASLAEALELKNLAAKRQRVLMVDHTFLYTSAVEKIKSLIDSGELGKLHYYDSTRINLGLFQTDVNVLWDLAAHDLAILQYLTKERPTSVNATGLAHLDNQKENIAYLTLNYNSGFIAHFHCSWVSPVKIRQVLVGGDRKMLLYNDMEATEKIKIYDTGYQMRAEQLLVDYRVGDIHIPKISMKEALAGVAEDFRDAILNNKQPRSSIDLGVDVVRVLEASQRSLQLKGAEVLLDS